MDSESENMINIIIGSSIALSASCLSSLAVNLQASALKKERIFNNLSEQDQFILEANWDDNETSHEDSNSSAAAIRDLTVWELLKLSCARSSSEAERVRLARKLVWVKTQWYFGFYMYLLCQLLGSVVALGFISPVILAPLGSSGLIFNIIFSNYFSGTRITNYDWAGTFLIVAGCAVVSTFGSSIPDPEQSLPELIRLFGRPAFIAYFSVELVVDLCIVLLIKYVEYNLETLKEVRSRTRRSSRNLSHPSIVIESTSADIFYTPIEQDANLEMSSNTPLQIVSDPQEIENGISRGRVSSVSLVRFTNNSENETSPLIRNSSTMSIRSVKKGRLSALVGILYATLGGMIAAVTLLLTKSGINLLVKAIVNPDSGFNGIIAFFLLVFLVLTVIIQVKNG